MVSWLTKPRLEFLFHLCAGERRHISGHKRPAPANVMVFAMGYRANEDVARCKDDEYGRRQILPQPR